MSSRLQVRSPSRAWYAPLASVVALTLLELTCASGAEPARDAFARAEASFFGNDFRAAERDYAEAQARDGNVEHRLSAALTRATIAWRVRGDQASASQRLTEAGALHWKPARVDMARSRLLEVAGNPSGAEAAARLAIAAAEDATESVQATVRLASTIVTRALRRRLDDRAVDSSDSGALHEVIELLTPIVRAQPGLPSAAHELVTAATLAGDGPALLEAWQSYYLVGTGDIAAGPLAAPQRTLTAILPGWHGPHEDDAALVKALAGSAFVEEAAAVALPSGSEPALGARDARVAEIVAYARWVRAVRRITDEYYRQVALGAGDSHAWLASLDVEGQSLWPQLDWGGDARSRYSRDRLTAELSRRFGAEMNTEKTAGTRDLHMGHRVVDERRTVRQYGKEADLRFVALDGMVSNGYQTWAWDGRAGHGGWAAKSLIVQVRRSYAASALAAWQAVSDAATAQRLDEAIARDSAEDLARGRSTPVAYFPSVVERMRRDALGDMVESLRSAGLSGGALQAAFVREFDRVSRESSIFAHEGRHAIDQKMGVLGGGGWWWDREFRAKLSEVAFAPRPRLALDAIMFSNIGDRTSHGRGNQQAMQGVLAWMHAHEGEIRGLLPADPLLPQLPLLSDQQLRDAFSSMDPLKKRL